MGIWIYLLVSWKYNVNKVKVNSASSRLNSVSLCLTVSLPFFFSVFLGGVGVPNCGRANILPVSLGTDFWSSAHGIQTSASPSLSVFGYLWPRTRAIINCDWGTELCNASSYSVIRKIFSFNPRRETIWGFPFRTQPASAPLLRNPRKVSQKTFGLKPQKRRVCVSAWKGGVATSDLSIQMWPTVSILVIALCYHRTLWKAIFSQNFKWESRSNSLCFRIPKLTWRFL